MRTQLLPAAVLCLAMAPGAWAQDWDPARSAMGWARFDKDGSCVFYNPGNKQLVTWSRDASQAPVDLSRLETPPEFWTLDSLGNAWVVVGNLLQQVDKNGKLGSRARLPGPVADLAWDTRGLVLSYRGSEPYVEKRDYKTGSLLWSWGSRPEGKAGPALYRVEVTEASEVLVSRGTSMTLDLIDGAKGKQLSQVVLNWKGSPAPDLALAAGDRLPMATWIGHEVVFAAVTGRQAPQAAMNGLLLARMDLARKTVDYLPTGLTEDFTLVGIFEDQAAFLSPKGGLAFSAIR